jgi:small GTP-binding protein
MKGFAPPSRMTAQVPTGPVPITRTITVTEGVSVKDLAEKLEIRGKDLIATLLMKGVFVTVNQTLDGELVKEVAAQFGADVQMISFEDSMANEAMESILATDNPDELEVTRPPVVTVMGHVDHGKTSLLDAIRETDVAGGEAGGITQHIGAYKVKIGKADSPAFGREIVFLDTPGHEAFTRMRARGAKVTDIVVIVVAADDGVMPQTLEAIDHAKAANVPMIVAVNKIDKPEAQPDRVKKQLGDRGLVPEEWGGSTVFVDVSAKKRINLDLLLEMICLVADIQALKSTPERSAVGTVIEAKLDRGRGAVATVLVQNGTLKNQDNFVVGNTFGKIRAMFDDRGRTVESAGPSTPVEIVGLEGMPDAGDTFLVVSDRDKARGAAGEVFACNSGRTGGFDPAGGDEGVAADPEGRRDGFGGSAGRLAAEDVDGKGTHQGDPLRRGCDHGERCAAGVGVECDHHRVQRAAGAQGRRSGGAGRSGDPAALDYLRVAGRDHQGDAGSAGAGVQGELPWTRGGAERVPHSEGGTHCRLQSNGRRAAARCRSAVDARRYAGVQRQADFAEAVQGRCEGSDERHGVRRQPLELHRY